MSNVSTSSVTVKFEQRAEQNVGEFKKIIGLVKVKNLIDLIDVLDLEANPRSSRVGTVTDAIDESLSNTRDIFPFKTKGILLGAASYETLERGRVKVSFSDPTLEGILDGGHNCLAIGLHVLEVVLGSSQPLKKVKTWTDFRTAWSQHQGAVLAYRDQLRAADDEANIPDDLEVLVPVELLVPRDPTDQASVDEFASSLLDICSARNNNVQLRIEARANQSGYFDHLKAALPPEISGEVEWKTNEGGSIKAADIVALTWIPLSVLASLPADENGKPVDPPVPQNIYRSKGDCVSRFERLMSSPDVTSEVGGKSTLHNERVKSALDVAADLPELFDYIYAELPRIYNGVHGGKFGRITAVKKMNPENTRSPKLSKFTRKPVDFNLPEGFVVPFVYGLKALMGIDGQGNVVWKTDPHRFLEKRLKDIVPQLAMFMAPLGYDPQKFGKEFGIYNLALTSYENALLQQQRR